MNWEEMSEYQQQQHQQRQRPFFHSFSPSHISLHHSSSSILYVSIGLHKKIDQLLFCIAGMFNTETVRMPRYSSSYVRAL